MELVGQTTIDVWNAYWIANVVNIHNAVIKTYQKNPQHEISQQKVLISRLKFNSLAYNQSSVRVYVYNQPERTIQASDFIVSQRPYYSSYILVNPQKQGQLKSDPMQIKSVISKSLVYSQSQTTIKSRSNSQTRHLSSKVRIGRYSYSSDSLLLTTNTIIKVTEKNRKIKQGYEYQTFILVRNRQPDYLAIISDNQCYGSGEISEFELPVRIGEFYRLFRIPDSQDVSIVKVYNKPFGIYHTDKELYGRILITQKHTLDVILNNQKKVKITLVPYVSEFVTWLANR